MPTPSRPVPTTLLSLTGFYQLTVEQYRKMIDAGVLVTGEPLELLEGYLVNSPRPLSPRAASIRTRVHYAFHDMELSGWSFFLLGALTLADSEPEPDFSIVRGDERTYSSRFPGPGEIGLVGEVSESSLQFDRIEKGRIYARAGIPAYWIVNVADKQIEVYSDPDTNANPPAYKTRTDYKPGDAVPITLDGRLAGTIPASELLP
jgi:Uma2 family endonuclease